MQTSAEPSLLEFCRVQPRLSKDHARGPEVLAAWSTQSRTKVPRRGTFSHKLLVFSWLKFLYEALGCSSLRTKLRASSMHLHGLSNKIGSSTRSASSMHRGVRGGFSESVNRYELPSNSQKNVKYRHESEDNTQFIILNSQLFTNFAADFKAGYP